MSSPLAPILSMRPDSLKGLEVSFKEESPSPPQAQPIPVALDFQEDIEPIDPAQGSSQDQFIFTEATSFLDKTFAWLASATSQLGKSLDTVPKIALFAIPLIGVGFAIHSESQKDEEGKKEVERKGFNTKKIVDLITEKNTIKWHALTAFTVNAAVFSLGLGIFPLACSVVATAYLCLVIKNLAQMHANKALIEEIKAGKVIAPVGPHGKLQKDRTEFVWSQSVE